MEPSHAHEWQVRAAFRGAVLDPVTGVLIDFLAVKAALDALAGELEGTDLNAHAAFAASAPSAERVAEFLARRLAAALAGEGRLYSLEVSEAPGCRAAFLCEVDSPGARP